MKKKKDDINFLPDDWEDYKKCNCDNPMHSFKIIRKVEYWKCANCKKEWEQKKK